MHQYRQHRFYLIKGRLQTALLVLSYLQIPISKAFKIRFRNFALDSVTHPIPFTDASITSYTVHGRVHHVRILTYKIL